MEKLIDLLLDSGAYSAFLKGAVIDIDQYIAYIKKNRKYITAYVGLDVLPGKDGVREFGARASEYAAAASHENQVRMRASGLHPIPVFHRGEKFKWLEKMIEGEPYIGLSPYLKANRDEVIAWLDTCFTILTDSEGRPLLKTHGFAVTAPEICWRYPWFSVDSTTWGIYSGFGLMYAPIYNHGIPDFSKPPIKYHLSHRPSEDPSSFDYLGPSQRRVVELFWKANNLTATRVRNNPNHRRFLQVKYFQGLEQTCTDRRFNHHRRELIPVFSKKAHLDTPPLKFNMKIYFATLIAHQVQVRVLQKAEAYTRLVSYHELSGVRPGFHDSYDNLKNFVTLGLARPDYVYKPKANWNRESYLIQRRMDLIDHIEEITNEANRPSDEAEI